MALTELGFNRPLYDEILENQIERAKALFGDDIDTSDQSALGKYIRLNVADLDELYQDLEGVYYARFPNTASGVNLDRLLPYAGITRNPATPARFRVRITGTLDADVEAGFEVSTENLSAVFHVLDNYTMSQPVQDDDESGYVDCLVECNESGVVGNVTPSSINTIVNPSAYIYTVAGIEQVAYGENRESDAALRVRFKAAIAGSASGTKEAIKGAIMRVHNVDGCNIVENATNETVDGIPAHAFKCYVSSDESPATDSAIAKAIFDKKPIGIKAVGSVSVDVIDGGGTAHTISFERSTQKDIYIKITLVKNSFFEQGGVDQIKNNIINYLAAFTNGTDVYMSALYSFINITGVVNVSSLLLSTDGENYSAHDIILSDNEIARTSADKITVTVL